MKFLKTKKGFALLAAVAVVGISAIGAYAYWTTTGAGSGSATNASSNGTLTLSATFAAGLTPGASEPVHFFAANPGTTDLRVGTVSSVVSIDAGHAYDATTNAGGCKASDFTVADVLEGQTIAHGTPVLSPVALTNDGSISFANSLTDNQDGCKGATVTLTLSSN